MQNLLSKGRLSSFLVPSFYRFSSSGSTATTTSSTSPQFEKNQKRNELIFYLNKKRISLPSGSFSTTTSLLDFVRESGLTGAKPGCLEGGCGACTLQVSSVRDGGNSIETRTVASCLLPLPYVHGCHVVTVEGLDQQVPEILARENAVQCGYCTPGIAVALATHAVNHEPVHSFFKEGYSESLEGCLDGNLCRCTGYRPIFESMKALQSVDVHSTPFPEELRDVYANAHEFQGSDGVVWASPNRLGNLLEILQKEDSKLVGGHTSWDHEEDLSLEEENRVTLVGGNTDLAYRKRYHPTVMRESAGSTHVSLAHIPELSHCRQEGDYFHIGGAVTIHRLRQFLLAFVSSKEGGGSASASAIVRQTRYFANSQVRGHATIGGSVCGRNPLGDLLVVLAAVEADLVFQSLKRGERVISASDHVINDTRDEDEVLVNVRIPFKQQAVFEERKPSLFTGWYADAYKHGPRRIDSQAAANAAFSVYYNQGEIQSAQLWVGAVSRKKVAIQLAQTSEAIIAEKKVTSSLSRTIKETLNEELEEQGIPVYQRGLASGFLQKFFSHSPRYHEDQHRSNYKIERSSQLDALSSSTSHCNLNSVIGQAHPQTRALQHASGKTCFVADIPLETGALHAVPILSTQPHGIVKSITLDEETMNSPGIVGLVSSRDVMGNNMLGSAMNDEPVFADEKVEYEGQLIALVIGETHQQALAAAQRVKVDIEPLPPIICAEEAFQKGQFLGEDRLLKYGPPLEEIAKIPGHEIVEGVASSGAQDHFYIETMCARATPPRPRVSLECTSQNPTKMQWAVARALGISANEVASSVDVIGGGFGGKQDRPMFLAAATAVAAQKYGKQVQFLLEREENMRINGARHPAKTTYRAVVNRDTGQLKAIELHLVLDGGAFLDLSQAVLEVALSAIDGVYSWDSFHVHGRVVRTNTRPNTAFRGFGKPQAVCLIEGIIDSIAQKLGLSPFDLRDASLVGKRKEKDIYLDNTPVSNNDKQILSWLWGRAQDLMKNSPPSSDGEETKADQPPPPFTVRGKGMFAVRNNTGFDLDFMNQATASVNINASDGSVLGHMSGVEMGQGLAMKVTQVIAQELGCNERDVVVNRTSTDVCANTNPTAATTGTDLNCGAIVEACKSLKERLNPYLSQHGGSFAHAVSAAYKDKICLQETGHFSYPKFAYDWKLKEGQFSKYYIWACAGAEVEIDVTTGSWHVRRLHLVADGGNSINPLIDIGQIEGAFLQGMGMATMEKLVWAGDGHLRTRNVSTYKIPSHDDAPTHSDFILLRHNLSEGVYGSKAIGEAGLQLGFVVASALRDAVHNYRKKAGLSPDSSLLLQHPLTTDVIWNALHRE